MILDKHQETYHTWNKIATAYQDAFMNLTIYNDTYDYFCNSIALENANILEIGCGPGNITKYLLQQNPKFKILATDVAPNMVLLTQQNCPSAETMVLNSSEIEKLNTSFHGIMIGFCLPYISKEDCSKLISDCANLLKKNGVLYLSFVEGDYDKSDFQSGSTGDRVFFYYHNLEHIRQLLTVVGFNQLEVMHKTFKRSETISETHTIVIAQ
jgi:ubiquinone/menaquinone biosynthesis C-methylase UbiE